MAGLINFKDENEVKQYLDNIGMEYSYQCYKEKDPEGNIHLHCFQNNVAEQEHQSSTLFIWLCFRVPKTGRVFGRDKKGLRSCSTSFETQL